MYKQRLHAFILLCIIAVVVCGVRLAYLQSVCCEDYKQQIEQLRIQPARQLATVRGSILDRDGRPVAVDRPTFFVAVNYQLTRLRDDRFWQMSLRKLMDRGIDREQADLDLHSRYKDDFGDLLAVIEFCAEAGGVEMEQVEDKIHKINDSIWRMRTHFAWRRKFPNADSVPYAEKLRAVSFSEIARVELREMYQDHSLVELADQRQLLDAEITLSTIQHARILPGTKRAYPHASAACQIIGWVGPAEPDPDDAFSEDAYSRYLAGELAGREGIERVCEPVLRGRRGEVQYDRDGGLVDRMDTVFGRDVKLAVDIELQKKIEDYLSDPNDTKSIASVVIDVASGDVLAMVSVPTFDLSTVRQNYGELLRAKNKPLANKAIAKDFNPGSSIKPIILIAGLQERKVSVSTVISCPFENQKPFPNCLLFRKYGSCHDWRWQNEGGNIARNAIRGSCNVYFSRLADRLDSRDLQRWLYNFGIGRRILAVPDFSMELAQLQREVVPSPLLYEVTGRISRRSPAARINGFDDIPKISPAYKSEKRYFGIGQGNLRATVLQIANAMAAIARGGIYKAPTLIRSGAETANEKQTDLNLYSGVIATVRDGMHAVVYEAGGTANRPYNDSILSQGGRDLKLFGKTGSTESPSNAWYCGWVQDSTGRAITVAIVVEGGQSGAGDAAPRALEIIRICSEAGYVGKKP